MSSHILQRQLQRRQQPAAAPQGVESVDDQGRRCIDASGDAAASCHGHPEVLAALHAQIDRVADAHAACFSTGVARRLAGTPVASAPAGTGRAPEHNGSRRMNAGAAAAPPAVLSVVLAGHPHWIF